MNNLIIIGALTMLGACVSQPATGPDYYLLSRHDLNAQSHNLKPFILSLGPVDIPIHLDREGIVTHESENKLSYADDHRWAEPLKENLTKVLHANLAQLLPNQQLIDFPYKQSNKPDYRLAISIEQFGFRNTGSVVLRARSTIMNAQGKQLATSYTDLERTDIVKNHGLIVQAMSELLAEMAMQQADKLQELLNT